MKKSRELLHGGPVDAGEVKRIRDIILFEGPDMGRRLFRFYCPRIES